MDKGYDENLINMIRNLPLNPSIIFEKRDVRAVSTKRNPGILTNIHSCNRARTSLSEDAFEKRSQSVAFEMKLRGHKKYLREICEKVDQDLGSPACKKLREHLSSCPFCSAYYESLKETILLYRKYDEKLRGSRVKKILAHIQMSEAAEIQHTRKSRPTHK